METFESGRLAALDRLEVLDTPGEQLFDSLAELASLTFNTPIALISLIDEKRHWVKAQIGLDVAHFVRDISVCHDAIDSNGVLVVSDAAEDGRFSNNPFLTGSPHIRFYAGAPLISPEGHRLGTVCVVDTMARSFTEADVLRLQVIAKSVMSALLLRLDRRERERLASTVTLQTKLLMLTEDMAGVGTWSWDVAADRTTWSDQVYRIHGYAPDVEPPALQGVLDRYHPDDAKLLATHVQRAVAEGLDYALQARIYRPGDGVERHVVARGACRKDADGRVIALVGTFQDITDLKRAEEKLIEIAADREELILDLTTLSATRGAALRQLGEREAELRRASQRLRQLINGVRDYAIYWLDPAGRVEIWNMGAQTIYGYEGSDIVGQDFSVFFTASDRAAGEPEHILATALRAGKWIGECWRVREDGTTFWAEVSVEAVYDDTGALIGFAKVSRDVTERREFERGRKAADDQRLQQENELREANRLMLMAEEMSLTGHWRLDVASNTLFWSNVVCAIHARPRGYVPNLEEAIEAYHPDDRVAVQYHVANAIAMGTSYEYDARIIGADGVTRRIVARGRTEVGPDGSVVAMFGVIQDITEASRQQQALIESEERYQLTIGAMSVGVWDWDIVNNHLYWSEKLLELMGLDKGQSVDLDYFKSLWHPDDKQSALDLFQQHVEQKNVYDIEYRVRHARGHYIWIHATGQAVWNENGEACRMSGSVADITDFKLQQQALVESEDTFRRAIENAVVGNVLMATDGRWLTVNRAFCKLVGYEEADLLRAGTALIQEAGEPWNLQDTVEALMSGSATVVEGERWLRHCNGHQLWVNVSASLVTRDGGARDYLVVQFQDLTERKRTEIMKDEFVSTVSHELRTPLTSLFGSLRLLGASTADMLDAKSERLLGVAQISATHLARLVDDILDIEKIAAGKMDYQMTTVAAQRLIADVIDRNQALADLHTITFKTHLNVNDLAICVDPGRFSQALLNLLSNAAKYSPAGDQVDILAHREGEAAIRISVTDHGPGIPEAFRSRIFGRFAQADNSTTRKVGGTGLGLNITKTLIEAFGGTVSFDSVEGQGATFHLVLPACELMAPELDLEAHD